MSILTTNLKHLYQRRGLWLCYLMLPPQLSFVFFLFKSNPHRYLGYLQISSFIGLMVAYMQMEILSKPFSFCLPGHSDIPRKFILWIGLVVNGLLGFVFLLYPGMQFPSAVLVILAGAVLGMIIYLAAVGLILVDLGKKGLGFSTCVIVIAFGGFFLQWDIIVQEMAVTSPLIVISSGLLLCWLVWMSLNRESLSRRYCGKMVITPLFAGFNREQMSKFTRQDILEEKAKGKEKPASTSVSPGVERFFISRISQSEPGSLQQYIWGTFYRTFGPVISRLRQITGLFIFLLLVCYILSGYTPTSRNGFLFIIIMPWSLFGRMLMNTDLAVYSSLSVSGGRRQLFWSTLTQAVTATIFVTIISVVLVLSTHLLERVIPQLTIKGHEFAFNAIDVKFSFVPLLFAPVILTIGLISDRSKRLTILFGVVGLLTLVIVVKLIERDVLVRIDLSHIIITLSCCSWAIFIAALRYISMRCRLVTQNK